MEPQARRKGHSQPSIKHKTRSRTIASFINYHFFKFCYKIFGNQPTAEPNMGKHMFPSKNGMLPIVELDRPYRDRSSNQWHLWPPALGNYMFPSKNGILPIVELARPYLGLSSNRWHGWHTAQAHRFNLIPEVYCEEHGEGISMSQRISLTRVDT